MIFVFGSNLIGLHGKGAALEAKQFYGAIQGQAEGRQGNSYAIPTKITPYTPCTLEEIKIYVDTFMQYAKEHEDEIFYLTAIGTGLAGYSHAQIAPMFKKAPSNVVIPTVWIDYIIERT